ncbi:GIY-YIG nuclease family protein [Blastococcus sp. SYSU DS0539]
MTGPALPPADQRAIPADLLEPRWRHHPGLTHAQWQENRREVLARRADDLDRTLAHDPDRWPYGMPDWRAEEYRRESALHQWAEELASQLLTVVGELGWGSGEPLEDACGWIVRVAEERSITSSPPVGDLVPPRRPDPAEFERFRHRLPTRGNVVYILRGADGKALYIGQTSQPRLRLRSHWRGQEWWPEVDRIELYNVADELEARALEYELTQELTPQHSQVTRPELVKLQRLQNALASRSYVLNRARIAAVVPVGEEATRVQ